MRTSGVGGDNRTWENNIVVEMYIVRSNGGIGGEFHKLTASEACERERNDTKGIEGNNKGHAGRRTSSDLLRGRCAPTECVREGRDFGGL